MNGILEEALGALLATAFLAGVSIVWLRWRRKSALTWVLDFPYSDSWQISLYATAPSDERPEGVLLPEEAYSWLLGNGGISYLHTDFRLFLTNSSRETVIIRNVTAVCDRRKPPARGALIRCPGGSANDSICLAFSLDESAAQAWEVSLPTRRRIGDSPFFSRKSVTLLPGEVIDFAIFCSAENSYAEWHLEVDCIFGARRVSRKITDERFKTSDHPDNNFVSNWHWAWYDESDRGPHFLRLPDDGVPSVPNYDEGTS